MLQLDPTTPSPAPTPAVDFASGSQPPFVEEVVHTLAAWRREGVAAALVTLVTIEGSSPRPLGAQMAVASDGRAVGYISGGCLEQAVIAEAQDALAAGANRTVRYGQGSHYIDIALPCGSALDLYFDVGIDNALLEAVLSHLDARQPVALATDLATGSSRLVADGDHLTKACHREGQFLRPYLPCVRLLIFGKGPIPWYLARLAQMMGLEAVLYSPEAELRQRAAADHLAPKPLTTPAPPLDFAADDRTAVVTLFHDHEWEPAILQRAVASEAFYIGALGSRRTHAARREALAQLGLPPAAVHRVRGPVGLIPRA
ncbi:MAG: XdhC family protein [Candidatus Competibacterales bacterium]